MGELLAVHMTCTAACPASLIDRPWRGGGAEGRRGGWAGGGGGQTQWCNQVAGAEGEGIDPQTWRRQLINSANPPQEQNAIFFYPCAEGPEPPINVIYLFPCFAVLIKRRFL